MILGLCLRKNDFNTEYVRLRKSDNPVLVLKVSRS